MKISTERAVADITRTATITNGPLVPMAYSRTPKLVQVNHVAIQYRWNNGNWDIRSNYSVTVSGYVLKKDGTPSKQTHRRSMPSQRWDGETWPWAEKIIDLLRPTSNADTMDLTDHEVTA